MSDRADDRDGNVTTCSICGYQSDDPDRFIWVGVEDADYSMGSPYAGSPGDPVCAGGCDGPRPGEDIARTPLSHSLRLADLPAGTVIGGICEV